MTPIGRAPVVCGVANGYEGDDHETPHFHLAGTSFVDDGSGSHIVVNEGDTDLVLLAFQILPHGAPRRIDQPAPEAP